jgi:uncharacterized DUF497 family protein
LAAGLKFEWDPAKAAINASKHGVTFMEATSAFGDLLSLTIPDPEHSQAETRYLLIGRTHRNRLVVVAHTEREDQIRIISARLPTPKEKRSYEQETRGTR